MKKNKRGFDQLRMWDPVSDEYQAGTQTAKLFDPHGGPNSFAEFYETDQTIQAFITPPLTSVVHSIMVEIAEEREAGLIRPFVEGEPIGMIRPPKIQPAVVYTKAMRYEARQQEIRTLRADNERAMARILEDK